MVSEAKRRAESRQTTINLVLGCLLIALVVVSGELWYASDGIFVVVTSVIFAAIIWAILRFALAGPSSSKITPLHLLILFAAGCAPGLATQLYLVRQARVANANIQSSLSRAMTPGSHIDAAPSAQGLPGEIEGFVKKELAAFADEQTRYLTELQAIGVAQTMTPSAVAAPGGLDAAAAAVSKAKTAAKGHRDRYNGLIEQLSADVETVKAPIEVKATLYDTIDKSIGKSKATVTQVLDLDDQAFEEMDREIQVLKAAKGRWNVAGGKLVFQDHDTLTSFNLHALKIQAIVAQENTIVATTRANMQKTLDSMGATAK